MKGMHIWFAAVLMCIINTVSSAQNQAFLWKIEASGGPVYLLGSIHAGENWFYPLPPFVDEAFKSADNLVVEVNITSFQGVERAVETFLDSAFYPSGDTLQKHISTETFRKVMKEFDRYSFDYYRLQKLRPWALAQLLSSLEMYKSDADSNFGVDLHYLKRANFLKKQILELETMEFQAGLFNGLTDREQELYLLATIDSTGHEAQDMKTLMAIWRSGDIARLEKYLNASAWKEAGMERLYAKILTERNRDWVGKVEQLMQEEGIDFIVVGAAHLVGKDSLVEMLRKKGHNITRQ